MAASPSKIGSVSTSGGRLTYPSQWTRPLILDLDNLVKLIQSPAYFFDVESGELLAANEPLMRLLGYTEQELLKMSVADLRPVEDIPKLRKALAQQPPEGSVEWRYKTRFGEILFVQITYRNSVFVERTGRRRDVRMVVISKWDSSPVISADELFG